MWETKQVNCSPIQVAPDTPVATAGAGETWGLRGRGGWASWGELPGWMRGALVECETSRTVTFLVLTLGYCCRQSCQVIFQTFQASGVSPTFPVPLPLSCPASCPHQCQSLPQALLASVKRVGCCKDSNPDLFSFWEPVCAAPPLGTCLCFSCQCPGSDGEEAGLHLKKLAEGC